MPRGRVARVSSSDAGTIVVVADVQMELQLDDLEYKAEQLAEWWRHDREELVKVSSIAWVRCELAHTA